jgi:V/A-type H+-transporting ATPase subunit F
MKFFCIADKDSALGFKLAGVETAEVSNQQEALTAFNKALSIKDIGVILVTYSAAEYIRPEISAQIYQRELPLVLELPSRDKAGKPRNANEFLKSAIGMSV